MTTKEFLAAMLVEQVRIQKEYKYSHAAAQDMADWVRNHICDLASCNIDNVAELSDLARRLSLAETDANYSVVVGRHNRVILVISDGIDRYTHVDVNRWMYVESMLVSLKDRLKPKPPTFEKAKEAFDAYLEGGVGVGTSISILTDYFGQGKKA